MPKVDGNRAHSSRRPVTKVSNDTRVDPAHSTNTQPVADGDPIATTPVQNEVVSATLSQQIRTQAEQLRSHLHAWQNDLDRREAQIRDQSVQLQNDAQTARLWLDQQAGELDDRHGKLNETERELQRRRDELEKQHRELLAQQQRLDRERGELAGQQAAVKKAREEIESDRRRIEAERKKIKDHLHRRKMIRQAAAILESRHRHLAEAEARLAEDRAAVQRRAS